METTVRAGVAERKIVEEGSEAEKELSAGFRPYPCVPLCSLQCLSPFIHYVVRAFCIPYMCLGANLRLRVINY